MRQLIRKCPSCGRYTLEDKCPDCGMITYSAHPPRFSPDDKYLELRLRDKLDTT